VVLMALVDAHYNFIVDVGAYGRNSEGGIFMHSKLGKGLEIKQLNVQPSAALPCCCVLLSNGNYRMK